MGLTNNPHPHLPKKISLGILLFIVAFFLSLGIFYLQDKVKIPGFSTKKVITPKLIQRTTLEQLEVKKR